MFIVFQNQNNRSSLFAKTQLKTKPSWGFYDLIQSPDRLLDQDFEIKNEISNKERFAEKINVLNENGNGLVNIRLFKHGDPRLKRFDFSFRKGEIDLNILLKAVAEKLAFSNTGKVRIFDTEGNRVKSIEQIQSRNDYVCSTTIRHFQPENESSDIKIKRPSVGHPILKNKGKAETLPASRTVKIVSFIDTSKSKNVILNLKTNQNFENVLKDLGQVVGIPNASKMLTRRGKEVNSFSQLLNSHSEDDLFYISNEESHLESKNKVRRHMSEPNVKSTFVINTKKKNRPENIIEETVPENLPKHELTLDWIYGCSFGRNKNNLFVMNNDTLVYPVSLIIVIYDRINETQRHYADHTNTIQCMDVSEIGGFAVSGQKGKRTKKGKPQVRLWSLKSLETFQVAFEK